MELDITIDKNIPLPTTSANKKFHTDKTIHQVMRSMDIMETGDSILITTNSITGKLVSESALKTWIKKYYMNKYSLKESDYQDVKKTKKRGYDLWMFDFYAEFAERSIDVDSETGEYVWENYYPDEYSGRFSKREAIELQRCKDENDFKMVEKYLFPDDEYKLCKIKPSQDIINAAKKEQYEKEFKAWELLDYTMKCKISKPTFGNTLYFKEPLKYVDKEGKSIRSLIPFCNLSPIEQYKSRANSWDRNYYFNRFHESHECDIEHPLEKKWNRQQVVKFIGYRLWRI